MFGKVETTRRLRVFVASPSDAVMEREVAQEVVHRVNESLISKGVQYDLVRWENQPGTAMRPQTALNYLVDSSDFMVCIFRQKWGSDPGGGLYSSGTEEELFTALIGLNDSDHPMRDVWLIFINDLESPRDPQVVELQTQIIDFKALIFEEGTNTSDFALKFEQRLRGWALNLGDKEARRIPLTPRSGQDVIGVGYHHRRARSSAQLGHSEDAESHFLKAIELGGPEQMLAYAKFLGRQNRLADALQQVDRAIEVILTTSESFPSLMAEALIRKASLQRRARNLSAAEVSLRSALKSVSGESTHSVRMKGRIFDELGVLLHERGLEFLWDKDDEEAARLFRAAQENLEKGKCKRAKIDDLAGVAQSNINLCRLCMTLNKHDEAVEYANLAVATLEGIGGGATLANAYLASAQVLMAKWHELNAEEVVDEAERAAIYRRAVNSADNSLSWNRQLKNLRGQAMAHGVLAQLHYLADNLDDSQAHAKHSVDINNTIGLIPPERVSQLAGGL